MLIVMDSDRSIIRKIIKEEIMSENAVARLLEWYKSWDDKLTKSINEGDYAKAIGTHFKTGLYLLSSLKSITKNNPELKTTFQYEIEMVRAKLLTLNKAIKLIESLK
jgi:hypothetical protein